MAGFSLGYNRRNVHELNRSAPPGSRAQFVPHSESTPCERSCGGNRQCTAATVCGETPSAASGRLSQRSLTLSMGLPPREENSSSMTSSGKRARQYLFPKKSLFTMVMVRPGMLRVVGI
eukprot:1160087-Amorphochlora_amoeboformis.AAC.1